VRVNTISNQSVEHGFGNIVACQETHNPRISVMEL